MKIKKIIIDANVFIEAVKNKINLFEQINDKFPDSEIITSAQIITELRKISKKKGSDAIAAKLALQIFSTEVGVKKTTARGDDSLLELCNDDSVLITQDRELRERCEKAGYSTAYIRDRKRLAAGYKKT